eukprot:jgi/Undpi1/897/HiC_scaffold_10.g04361.m1
MNTLAAAAAAPADGPPGEDRAALQAQRVVRGFLGRLSAVRQANLIYEKIFDPRTGGYYYYNTRTFTTTWNPPAVLTRILGELGDLDAIAPTYAEDEATVMIQAAWRRRRAKRTVRALLASLVTKIWDESSGAHYYFNSQTGETSWSKPTLFGSEDIEDYFPGGFPPVEGGSSASQGQGDTDYFGAGSYGYEQPEDWQVQEAWTHQQHAGDGSVGYGGEGSNTTAVVGAGYEGWVWDEVSGWYYDEALAATQLASRGSGSGVDTGTTGVPNDEGGDVTFGAHGSATENSETSGESDTPSSEDSDSDDTGSGEAGSGEKRTERGKKRQRKRRRRRSLAPRRYPRSKSQRLVDEAEDSVDGARPDLLDLSELEMIRVTSRVYELDWLERLNSSRNRLSRISPDLGGMDNLVDLDLQHNRIQTIPNELEALTKLKHLRLGYNRIGGFRGNIYLMSSLQTLDLGHNRLKKVPLQVGDLQLLKRTREWEVGLRLLKELVTLDVSYNLLERWPAQAEECAKLRHLNLGHNKLRQVPEVVGDNTALTTLDLSGNAIKRLPDTVNSLSSLTFLDLSHNELNASPFLPVGRKESGPRLVSLEVLRLDNNRLEEWPAAVETLKTLTELDVSHNPISNWKFDASGLRKMKHLRMRGVGLEKCPEGLGQLDKLEALDLAENHIDTLDPGMAKLFKLKTLDLRGNSIKDLGHGVGNMMSLVSLDVGGNDLERIPSELSRCTALERLDLSGGKVETLPEAFSKLTRLRCLGASDNRLGQIPPAFASLIRLDDLRLDGNALTCLPDSLRSLVKMRYADLSRNRIETVPTVTRHWPLLTHIVLSRNPLGGRHRESCRLLQAAQLGHEAMHRGAWEEAVRHLNVAAEAYDDLINIVPDFPSAEGLGPPLAQTRPHDMSTFHHSNLGVAHLARAREVAAEAERRMANTPKQSCQESLTGSERVPLGKRSAGGATAEEGSSAPSNGTAPRGERRRKELELMSMRETRGHHLQAANTAFSYADHLDQLSRPVGRTAEVWLGRAAVAAEMKDPAAALNDLERALIQLRGNAKIRSLLAKARMELGQYERGLTDCRVASRLLKQEERLLGEREVEQERRDKEAAAAAAAAAASAESKRKAEERLAARKRVAAEAAAAEAAEATAAEAAATAGKDEANAEATKAAATAESAAVEGGEGAAATTNVAGEEREEEEAKTAEETKRAEIFPELSTSETTATTATLPAKTMEETAPAATNWQGSGENGGASPPAGKGLTLGEGHNHVDTAVSRKSQDWAEYEARDRSGLPTGGAKNTEGKNLNTISRERAELAKQRQDLAALVAQGEEGIAFVKQSVDMADILRGFVITPHGVPVRDMDRELLLQGRSTLRDRSVGMGGGEGGGEGRVGERTGA